MDWNATVVIATRNRPAPLRECLASIAEQDTQPREVLVIDASDGSETEHVVRGFRKSLEVGYVRSDHRSAAKQRNEGISRAAGDVIIFLDDDIVLHDGFFREIAELFRNDAEGRVGGISGAIEECSFTPLSLLNRILLAPAIGWTEGRLGGRLLGPAVNIIPEDLPDTVQQVEWLASTCVAYRRAVLANHRFAETFAGYSFAEDVHMSARIARTTILLSTARARVNHKDLGKDTHRDWSAFGEMMIVNRHAVMTMVMGRSSVLDHLRLFYYEAVYGTVAFFWLNHAQPGVMSRSLSLLKGRLRGVFKILSGRSPHLRPLNQSASSRSSA